MDMWLHPTLYTGCNYWSMLGLKLIHVSKRVLGGCNYLSMLGLKLIHVSKRGPWWRYEMHRPARDEIFKVGDTFCPYKVCHSDSQQSFKAVSQIYCLIKPLTICTSLKGKVVIHQQWIWWRQRRLSERQLSTGPQMTNYLNEKVVTVTNLKSLTAQEVCYYCNLKYSL